MTFQLYLHVLPLSFLPVFQCFRNDALPFGQNHCPLTGGVLRLRPGTAGHYPSTADDFGRTLMYRPETGNTGRKGEWQSGDKIEALFSDIISSDTGHQRYFLGHNDHCETT